MSDTLVLDMSTQSEGAAAVFTKRDWLAILDNQNQNYQGNQCVIDTSQLANSNKYMNYREAYLTVPMILTMTSPVNAASTGAWAVRATSADFAVGLKNWYGSIIHSFTVDLQGTTIVQQTPYIGLWNSFKLMTSLSLDDVRTQGSLIGFYPDTAGVVHFNSNPPPATTTGGIGTLNNRITAPFTGNAEGDLTFPLSCFTSWLSQSESMAGPANAGVNMGLYQRILAWNFDPEGAQGGLANTGPVYATDGVGVVNALGMTSRASLNTLWQSYIYNKISSTGPVQGVWQCAIMGCVYLKHVHSFFERIPLLKGIFMKLTLNLNQTSVTFGTSDTGVISTAVVNSPLGGVSPIMLTDPYGGNLNIYPIDGGVAGYIVSLAVGNKVLNNTQLNVAGIACSPIGGGSITLNIPAYTFNPVFEQSYLSSPIKKIVYTDVYQYQIVNQILANATFNNLVTNGIANIKSVLLVPFYSASANAGLVPIQSPFDPAGGGPTSPYIQFSQFNIQISGQNAIYNTERYSHEQFNNQFKGVNQINGGQTDGLVSGLIGSKSWFNEYCYYYVNCGRMIPVEESVPKSVNVLGQNMSPKPIDLYVFVEYGCEVSIDSLSGARV